jgi:hypothetical protein
MLAAALIAINGRAELNRQWKPYWFVLAAVFVFLSVDESVQVHERLMGFMQPRTGYLMFTWIIPYGIACLALGFLYLPFVVALPRPIRRRVILAGGLFLAAALGMEAASGHCATLQGTACWKLVLIAEESGETIALTLFILALLALLRSRSRTFAFRI